MYPVFLYHRTCILYLFLLFKGVPYLDYKFGIENYRLDFWNCWSELDLIFLRITFVFYLNVTNYENKFSIKLFLTILGTAVEIKKKTNKNKS